MKNIGRKGLNLSLDLIAVATGAISIFNFFRKKKPNGDKKSNLCDSTRLVRRLQDDAPSNQASDAPLRIDIRRVGRRRGTCYCGQAGCTESADNDSGTGRNGN